MHNARYDATNRLKMLTPKQMLQRLSIALAEAKADNTSNNLLNEIQQIIYSLCQVKKTLLILKIV